MRVIIHHRGDMTLLELPAAPVTKPQFLEAFEKEFGPLKPGIEFSHPGGKDIDWGSLKEGSSIVCTALESTEAAVPPGQSSSSASVQAPKAVTPMNFKDYMLPRDKFQPVWSDGNTTFPVVKEVDLQESREAVANVVGKSLLEHGFFFLELSEASQYAVAKLHDASTEFFDLPLPEKETCQDPVEAYLGYRARPTYDKELFQVSCIVGSQLALKLTPFVLLQVRGSRQVFRHIYESTPPTLSAATAKFMAHYVGLCHDMSRAVFQWLDLHPSKWQSLLEPAHEFPKGCVPEDEEEHKAEAASTEEVKVLHAGRLVPLKELQQTPRVSQTNLSIFKYYVPADSERVSAHCPHHSDVGLLVSELC